MSQSINKEKKFDLAIIGGGPGGYVAAIRASQLGAKVALIEKENLGGVCLNWGCIPTKALLRCAELYHLMRNSEKFGILCKEVTFELEKMVKRSRDVSSSLSGGIKGLMQKNKIEVFYGNASFQNNKLLQIKAKEGSSALSADNIIIATGARSRELKHLPIDNNLVLNYSDAMSLHSLPQSLLIVGSGAIGIEFASFYSMLGVNVTVVEVENRILINEDLEISAMAQKAFTQEGITVLTSASVKNLKKFENYVEVEIQCEDGGKSKIIKQRFDKIISAVGVVPNTEDLCLEKTKVKLDNRGFIAINRYMQTDDVNIYAIGDVTTAPLLAHKASHQAVVCVEKIMSKKKDPAIQPIDKDSIPACTYSYPQIASIGLTEERAVSLKKAIKVGRFPGIGNGKLIAEGEEKYAFVKTIFDAETGELLGAHMIGHAVVEMIYGFAILKKTEGMDEDIIHTIFPHPTASEMIHESVLNAMGRAIHI